MGFLEWIVGEARSYGALAWLCFAMMAFCAARFGRFWGIALGFVAIAAAVLVLDVIWVFDQMKNHPENGKDADMIFVAAAVSRAAVFNMLLIPVSVVGLRMSSRKSR